MLRSLQAEASARAAADLVFLNHLPDALVAPIMRLLPQSKAQFRQDLFVLAELEIIILFLAKLDLARGRGPGHRRC